MNAKKKKNSFRTVLLLSLLLWNPLQAGAFPQNSGAGMTGAMGGGPSMPGVSGRVIEAMDSGGYTYALVDANGANTWVALPRAEIAVGSDIACLPGMTMHNFTSSSLNRTFASIVFSSGLATAGAAPAPASSSIPAPVIAVSRADGPDGRTIAEVFADKENLANKPVTVQARVVKVTHGIMGKNWLHLQDGTGSQAAGSNDLVVTTDAVAEVGEVVTIRGDLTLDRDFGSGYRYGVIIEGAELSGK